MSAENIFDDCVSSRQELLEDPRKYRPRPNNIRKPTRDNNKIVRSISANDVIDNKICDEPDSTVMEDSRADMEVKPTAIVIPRNKLLMTELSNRLKARGSKDLDSVPCVDTNEEQVIELTRKTNITVDDTENNTIKDKVNIRIPALLPELKKHLRQNRPKTMDLGDLTILRSNYVPSARVDLKLANISESKINDRGKQNDPAQSITKTSLDRRNREAQTAKSETAFAKSIISTEVDKTNIKETLIPKSSVPKISLNLSEDSDTIGRTVNSNKSLESGEMIKNVNNTTAEPKINIIKESIVKSCKDNKILPEKKTTILFTESTMTNDYSPKIDKVLTSSKSQSTERYKLESNIKTKECVSSIITPQTVEKKISTTGSNTNMYSNKILDYSKTTNISEKSVEKTNNSEVKLSQIKKAENKIPKDTDGKLKETRTLSQREDIVDQNIIKEQDNKLSKSSCIDLANTNKETDMKVEQPNLIARASKTNVKEGRDQLNSSIRSIIKESQETRREILQQNKNILERYKIITPESSKKTTELPNKLPTQIKPADNSSTDIIEEDKTQVSTIKINSQILTGGNTILVVNNDVKSTKQNEGLLTDSPAKNYGKLYDDNKRETCSKIDVKVKNTLSSLSDNRFKGIASNDSGFKASTVIYNSSINKRQELKVDVKVENPVKSTSSSFSDNKIIGITSNDSEFKKKNVMFNSDINKREESKIDVKAENPVKSGTSSFSDNKFKGQVSNVSGLKAANIICNSSINKKEESKIDVKVENSVKSTTSSLSNNTFKGITSNDSGFKASNVMYNSGNKRDESKIDITVDNPVKSTPSSSLDNKFKTITKNEFGIKATNVIYNANINTSSAFRPDKNNHIFQVNKDVDMTRINPSSATTKISPEISPIESTTVTYRKVRTMSETSKDDEKLTSAKVNNIKSTQENEENNVKPINPFQANRLSNQFRHESFKITPDVKSNHSSTQKKVKKNTDESIDSTNKSYISSNLIHANIWSKSTPSLITDSQFTCLPTSKKDNIKDIKDEVGNNKYSKDNHITIASMIPENRTKQERPTSLFITKQYNSSDNNSLKTDAKTNAIYNKIDSSTINTTFLQGNKITGKSIFETKKKETSPEIEVKQPKEKLSPSSSNYSKSFTMPNKVIEKVTNIIPETKQSPTQSKAKFEDTRFPSPYKYESPTFNKMFSPQSPFGQKNTINNVETEKISPKEQPLQSQITVTNSSSNKSISDIANSTLKTADTNPASLSISGKLMDKSSNLVHPKNLSEKSVDVSESAAFFQEWKNKKKILQ